MSLQDDITNSRDAALLIMITNLNTRVHILEKLMQDVQELLRLMEK